MGHTILAHVLYASSQVNLDLANFFSKVGDSHKIQSLNNSKLTAEHLVEVPDSNLTCVLTLVSTGWEELLRHKMSYCKWSKAEPNLQNYKNFFQNHYQTQQDEIWLDFYKNVKDPSWPECPDYDSIRHLPEQIQKEIKAVWVEPSFEINTEYKLIEFLTLSYYDKLAESSKVIYKSNVYDLGQYLSGNFDELIKLSNLMTWKWDQHKSKNFYSAMVMVNQPYIDWLNIFKHKYQEILKTENLDWTLSTWEFSFMLAKILFDHGKNPRSIKWQSLNCFFDKKSLQLTQLIG